MIAAATFSRDGRPSRGEGGQLDQTNGLINSIPSMCLGAPMSSVYSRIALAVWQAPVSTAFMELFAGQAIADGIEA